MRELWIKINSVLTPEEKRALIKKTVSIASAFIVEPSDLELAKEMGAKTIVSSSEKGDIILTRNLKEAAKAKKNRRQACIMVTVKSKEDETQIVSAAESSVKYTLVECPNWKIIPLENLIALSLIHI